jgi:biopolymer transport protein TolQ
MDSVLPVYLATVAAPGEDAFSIVSLFTEADWIVQLVLFGLLGMSVTCWAIVVNKYNALSRASRQSAAFSDLFWKSRRLDQVYEQAGRFPASPIAAVFKAGYVELSKLTTGGDQAGGMDLGLTENIERALRRAQGTEQAQLERLTTFLATTGSTAPFIGLFGTVWGILRAFQKIGATGQATIQTVGPDIAHALVATAVGLLAAIPAVMAFNYFNSRIRAMAGEMDGFASDFLNIVKRHYRGR